MLHVRAPFQVYLRHRCWIPVLGIVSGCAAPMRELRAPLTGGRDPLLSAELVADAGPTAYESVERLRPYYFTASAVHSRGQSQGLQSTLPTLVYIDGHRIGGIDALRNIPTTSVLSIRYVRGFEAMTLLGSGHTGGAILVELHKGPSR